MTQMHLYRIQPHFSGTDVDGWSHSLSGPTMVIAGEDEGEAVRALCNLAWGLTGFGWPERHCYALASLVTPEESPYGRLLDDHRATWVRVSYWHGGIETVIGDTYASVKHQERTH